jgi:hypothetical protein
VPSAAPPRLDGTYVPSSAGWLPSARIARHWHRCPDGTRIVCVSQLLLSRGVVLDRWKVRGELIAVSVRDATGERDHEVRPGFVWADARMTAGVSAEA